MASMMSTASSTGGVQSRCVYTAASANRASQVADWAYSQGETELMYASNKSIVYARAVGRPHPPPAQLITTSHGTLTVVKFVYAQNGRGVPKVLAASVDGWLYLLTRHSSSSSGWRVQYEWQASVPAEPTTKTNKRPLGKIKLESAASVRALGALRRQTGSAGEAEQSGLLHDEYIFASATSDGMLQIWRVRGEGQVERLQAVSLGSTRTELRTEVLPLDIAMARVPNTERAILLMIAGTDAKIDVLLADDGKSFTKLFSLLGHSDWVRSLDICQSDSSKEAYLVLASSSQDHGVRLWKINKDAGAGDAHQAQRANDAKSADVPVDDFDKLARQIEEGEDEAIATKMQAFRCEGQRWSITFDALLLGHEHWVTGVRWAPCNTSGQPAALLTSSADNSVILWTPSSCVTQAMSRSSLFTFHDVDQQSQDAHEQDVWVAVHRFGEVGSVGSAANGMYGVAWEPTSTVEGNQQTVLGHGYGGALHVWTRREEGSHVGPWKAIPGLGGHFAPAMTVRWEPGGQYILSGGSDKTTRLHGCYRNADGSSWHEIARPQTHGYEIVALSWLSRLAFASAGDEKVIRAFEAPQGFVDSAQTLDLVSQHELSNVLAFSVQSIASLLSCAHLADPIKEATRRSLHKGKLDIVVVSPLFDDVEKGGAPKMTFEQAESFLKWCYAQAWSEAVEADELLFDVDVVLLGQRMAMVKLDEQLQADAFFVVDNKTNQLAFPTADSIMLSPGKEASAEGTQASEGSIAQHKAIAMGGTFDHLHVGHKILLSMACLVATHRIVVGVTDDSMLSKKKHASFLESTQDRINRVRQFLTKFSRWIGRASLKHDVVTLQDVAGPAGTDKDLTALLFTDETVGGADFIDGEREKRGLNILARLSIGVIGAAGETDVKGKDASELAAAKVGSTAIRGWIENRDVSAKDESGKGVSIPSILPSLDQVGTLNGEPRPVGASVPPLGLSNRAVYDATREQQEGPSETGQPIGKAIRSIALHLTCPPVEEQLHNHSLWSEVTKVYGHSLELLALDAHLASGLIASSCKAAQPEHAGIRIHYDSRRGWQEAQVLMGHALGVTRVRFSANGKRLVSVSRDRSWRVFADGTEQGDESDGPFALQAVEEEAHARIIYDVAWCSDDEFATASRDGTVKVWRLLREDSTKAECIATLSHKQSVSAVAAAHDLLAFGSEAGTVWVYRRSKKDDTQWHLILTLVNLHADALNELAFQPVERWTTDVQRIMLASAGQDGAVRLTEVTL